MTNIHQAQDQHVTLDPIIKDKLCDIVGAEQCLTGTAGAAFYTDVYRQLEVPDAVVRPTTVEQLQQLVAFTNEHDICVTIRGGGASYTDGYLPAVKGVVILDLSLLNKIVEINETDGYVTVEAGVTWSALKDELDKRNLRTPFWGPFSGIKATVGGSVSQNTISHGSGLYGISAQSVQAVDIVLGDGSLLQTGSASAGASPFMRHFGPDLTGLFTGDCGALGIKARITLPLIRRRSAHRVISFAFADFNSMHESMRRIGLERLEDTHFALDGALSQGQIARQDSAGQTLKIALSILTSSPSYLAGIKQLFKSAFSARKAISSAPYMTHYIVEGTHDAEVKSRLHRIRELTTDLGSEIPATVPAIVRGMPFAPFFNTLGPAGERWVPLHGIIPHSNVAKFHQQLEQFYAQRSAEMQRLGIWCGGMFATVASSGFLYEIALYWPDEITAYHKEVVPQDYLANLPKHPANLEAREYIHQLKEDIIALYVKHNATNFQLGKAYPYASRVSPQTLELIKNIKQVTDPKNTFSPGTLGL
ncbi:MULTISPECIES: FAD-binding oxidoreductase [Aliiglaciecola]|uniref:FAD-binding oxidoreductase n=1 Tax=Aliiglaciecola TaxID=1406885 RepID=UPI001C07F757|nr:MULTISPECIES: FAD-binding oxidoreductase [Aliiglaciecola]MBU2879002.1 FAD-binding oxidoreductase [Aliiglaciecola lipolytica]MDO6710700.1 FAD-binding oxidoreductase [Aliiglaciecola sp. 2_MG-2023]MDO6751892.1 FAD-binding oxidoreductase [Aliiglaciecola sp. 1_MG-2023]